MINSTSHLYLSKSLHDAFEELHSQYECKTALLTYTEGIIGCLLLNCKCFLFYLAVTSLLHDVAADVWKSDGLPTVWSRLKYHNNCCHRV